MQARREDWKHQPMAPPFDTLALERSFTPGELEQIARGRVPTHKSDRWFIYQEDDQVYFHRALSGECVFQLQLEKGRALQARVARLEGFTPDDQRALLEHLIDRLLLGKNVPPPRIQAFRSLDTEKMETAWKNLLGG